MRIVIECLNAVEVAEVLSAMQGRGEMVMRMGGRPGEETARERQVSGVRCQVSGEGSSDTRNLTPVAPVVRKAGRGAPKAPAGDGRKLMSEDHRLATGFTHAKKHCPALTFEFYREHLARFKETRLHTAGMNWAKYFALHGSTQRPT